jgi:hypothetical protein
MIMTYFEDGTYTTTLLPLLMVELLSFQKFLDPPLYTTKHKGM